MAVDTFTPERNRKDRALGLGLYTSRHVARLSAVPVRSLGYWRTTSLIVPRIERGAPGHPSLYTYIDLCELRVVTQLKRGGLGLRRIRRSLDYLKAQLPSGESWYSSYKLRTDGASVFALVKSEDALADIVEIRGRAAPEMRTHVSAEQKVVVATVGDIVQQFETEPELAYLREFVGHVDIRPDILAGAPVVKHTRLSTAFVASLSTGGWTDRMILDAYPTLTPTGIEKAWKFEEVIDSKAA